MRMSKALLAALVLGSLPCVPAGGATPFRQRYPPTSG